MCVCVCVCERQPAGWLAISIILGYLLIRWFKTADWSEAHTLFSLSLSLSLSLFLSLWAVQMCMMNPVHTLATTRMHKVTNGRATRDNHPGQDRSNAGNGLVLGTYPVHSYAYI